MITESWYKPLALPGDCYLRVCAGSPDHLSFPPLSARDLALLSARSGAARPLVGRAYHAREIVSGVNKGEVREGLREIAELAPVGRVDLFGQQPNVVSQRQ